MGPSGRAGATLGDVLTKSHGQGGFEFGRIFWAPEQVFAVRFDGAPDTPLPRP